MIPPTEAGEEDGRSLPDNPPTLQLISRTAIVPTIIIRSLIMSSHPDAAIPSSPLFSSPGIPPTLVVADERRGDDEVTP
ncbi:MAG: hypothetical protein ACP5RH_10535, partial [Leptodesmis sp.]|uniref:hypothetical protein n=1 Tax=Leptodesmis sp. TaxID=3100501 RepID=UPI003D10EE9A